MEAAKVEPVTKQVDIVVTGRPLETVTPVRARKGIRSNALDEDAKQMLKDCQDYLHGQTEYSGPIGVESADQMYGQYAAGRSVHSSPGDSYNRYNSGQYSPATGSLETVTPRTSANINLADNNNTGHKRVSKTRSVSSLNVVPVHSSPGGSKEPSISSRKTSKTSLDMTEGQDRISEWSDKGSQDKGMRHNDRLSDHSHDINYQVTVDAREKLAASKSSTANRERRNSFRKAVDRDVPGGRVDRSGVDSGRSYEQIWMRGEAGPSSMDDTSTTVSSSGESPRSAVVDQSDSLPTSKNINTRSLSNYPVYANAAARTSGSYDNVRIIPHQHEESQYKNIPFTVEELSKKDTANEITGGTGEIIGGYEPVNFHNIRINEQKPSPSQLQDGYNNNNTSRSSKTSLLSSSSPQDRGSKSSILSSASLVAEACRDYERGGRIGLPTNPPVISEAARGAPGSQSAEPQKPVFSGKQAVQKKGSGGGGGVRLPPPYLAPPGPLYQPTPQYQNVRMGPQDGTPARVTSSLASTPVRSTPRSKPINQSPQQSAAFNQSPQQSTAFHQSRHPPAPLYNATGSGNSRPPASSPQQSAQVPDQYTVAPPASTASEPFQQQQLDNKFQFSGVVHRRNPRETN